MTYASVCAPSPPARWDPFPPLLPCSTDAQWSAAQEVARRVEEVQSLVATAVSTSEQVKRMLELEVAALRAEAAAGASDVRQREKVSVRQAAQWGVIVDGAPVWQQPCTGCSYTVERE